jgi:hypothetical protein
MHIQACVAFCLGLEARVFTSCGIVLTTIIAVSSEDLGVGGCQRYAGIKIDVVREHRLQELWTL